MFRMHSRTRFFGSSRFNVSLLLADLRFFFSYVLFLSLTFSLLLVSFLRVALQSVRFKTAYITSGTVFVSISRYACTNIVVDQVMAGPTVLTRVRTAVVNIWYMRRRKMDRYDRQIEIDI